MCRPQILSTNQHCHPERSEGPAFATVTRHQVLRFAQDDNSSRMTTQTYIAQVRDTALADGRITFLRINSKIANCLLQQLRADAFAAVLLLGRLLPRQSMQRGKHNMLSINFEKISQRCTILAAPETV